MAGFFKVLRNNWKKSTAAGLAVAYGSSYLVEQFKTNQAMRAYCNKALQYGDQSISVSSKPRHVTVILNPAAKNGKGKKLFEKYGEPLLNLAGIRVSTISTEHEGQAREIMEIMENTDAVLVAGGDGTLHEAITGLLRREDEENMSSRIQIGIAPIGKKNRFAKSLFPDFSSNESLLLAEATMAVIEEVTKPVNVLKIQGEQNKPVFALSQLEYGALRDINPRIEKFWYLGPLKTKFTYLIAVLKDQPKTLELGFEYLLPCGGCNKCYQQRIPQKAKESQDKRWWKAFLPKTPLVSDTSIKVDFSQIVNENCGIWFKKKLRCSDIMLTANTPSNSMKVLWTKPLSSRTELITKGWTGQHDLSISEDDLNVQLVSEAKLTQSLEEGEERWLSIDNENYEAQKHLNVALLQAKINVYVRK